MQHIELQKMGLMELRQEECEQVNGGSIWKIIFTEAIRHADEIISGFKKGYNNEKL
ncbi:hypothetical protein [Flavitalea sp.]|nr:hypothetical protein [Flavitalea sp.]